MCLTFERDCGMGGLTPHRAGAFAGAAVIASLAVGAWQVSQDVEESMASAVAALPRSPTFVSVTLHREWIDVRAESAGVVAERRCISRRVLSGAFSCAEGAPAPAQDRDMPVRDLPATNR